MLKSGILDFSLDVESCLDFQNHVWFWKSRVSIWISNHGEVWNQEL